MCIAIVKPSGKELSKDLLKRCSVNNPDGCGMAYVKDGTVYIEKFMEFDDFYKSYEEVKDLTLLIHFRIATHGEVELKNCHPFKLNDRMALIHNGVISGYGDKKTKTDTQDFIDKVIGNISWKMWKNPSFIELVNNAIGYSKLCILDCYNNYYIVGEEKGDWVDGVWFSNASYKPKEVKKYTNNKTYYQNSFWDMYGDESYDDWYARFYNKNYVLSGEVNKKDDKPDEYLIYKCNKCGKVFYELEDVEPMCDVCKSTEVAEIGMKFGKDEYIYEDGSTVLV